MKTLLALLVLALVCIAPAYSAEYDARLDQTIKLLEGGQSGPAMDTFFEGNRYMSGVDQTYQNQAK